MDFRGHLRLPEDAGTGIPVVLRVDDIYIVITTDGEELGSWRADEVSVQRIFSNQFTLDLAGEPMVFLASDALGFAYEGVTAIEELQARLTKRRVFKRKKAATKFAPETPDTPAQAPSEVVAPQPLWTPPSTSAIEPGIELPLVPAEPFEPSHRQRDRDETPPTDSRVIYPSAKAAEPEPEVVAESAAKLEPVVEPEPVAVPEPVAELEPVIEPEQEALSEPVADSPVTAEPEPPLFEFELEVEEVGLATSGGSWIEPESLSPEPEPEPEVEPLPEEPVFVVEPPAAEEMEIEDYEPAAAAAVETFVAPAREPATGPAEDAEKAVVEEPEADLGPESATEPTFDASIEIAAEVEPLVEATAVEPLAEIPKTEPSEVDALNGHGEESSAKTAQKPSFFRREKKPAPHDHVYGEPKTIGGLKRSVCDICGHVTFSGEDVYHGW